MNKKHKIKKFQSEKFCSSVPVKIQLKFFYDPNWWMQFYLFFRNDIEQTWKCGSNKFIGDFSNLISDLSNCWQCLYLVLCIGLHKFNRNNQMEQSKKKNEGWHFQRNDDHFFFDHSKNQTWNNQILIEKCFGLAKCPVNNFSVKYQKWNLCEQLFCFQRCFFFLILKLDLNEDRFI